MARPLGRNARCAARSRSFAIAANFRSSAFLAPAYIAGDRARVRAFAVGVSFAVPCRRKTRSNVPATSIRAAIPADVQPLRKCTVGTSGFGGSL